MAGEVADWVCRVMVVSYTNRSNAAILISKNDQVPKFGTGMNSKRALNLVNVKL
jgi:hypothetical protein